MLLPFPEKNKNKINPSHLFLPIMHVPELTLRWKELIFISFCLITLIQLFYYSFFFARLVFFEQQSKTVTQTHPVSVIICAKDEAENLSKNLLGALVQKYSTTHEVIVINDNSFDESKYILEEYQRIYKQLQLVELKQEARFIQGKKFPLSIGIKTAKHEIVLLTDADCVPASEFWIEKMQDGYRDGTEIVLGYGALHKKKGLFNKLVRWETFHTALQYLSYALAGLPYMGVGRNLSYKKSIFFRHKGFSSHNNIPGGDDDLFINKSATKSNTAIIIDKDAFTLSSPAASWKQWKRQKARHYTTSKYYKSVHKFLLGLYAFSHFFFYPLFVAAILFFSWRWALIVFGIRFMLQGMVLFNVTKKLDEKDLFPWFLVLDIWMFFYYILFASALYKKPSKGWK
ncbi:MAG: glycosyltransferase [Bacteroidota bacterium]|nr:glycosyltransferase [Bacteroidota bacterium]